MKAFVAISSLAALAAAAPFPYPHGDHQAPSGTAPVSSFGTHMPHPSGGHPEVHLANSSHPHGGPHPSGHGAHPTGTEGAPMPMGTGPMRRDAKHGGMTSIMISTGVPASTVFATGSGAPAPTGHVHGKLYPIDGGSEDGGAAAPTARALVGRDPMSTGRVKVKTGSSKDSKKKKVHVRYPQESEGNTEEGDSGSARATGRSLLSRYPQAAEGNTEEGSGAAAPTARGLLRRYPQEAEGNTEEADSGSAAPTARSILRRYPQEAEGNTEEADSGAAAPTARAVLPRYPKHGSGTKSGGAAPTGMRAPKAPGGSHPTGAPFPEGGAAPTGTNGRIEQRVPKATGTPSSDSSDRGFPGGETHGKSSGSD